MTPTVLAFLLVLLGSPSSILSEPPAGVGMVQVLPGETLYFYGDASGHPSTATPLDSLTFSSGPHHIELAYGPPWFAPANLKLDYDLLFLRAVALRRHWVEVVVHTEDVRWPPQTMWLDREAVVFRSWPEFLLEVFGVEPLDPSSNPLRVAPDDGAEAVASDQTDFRPLTIQGEWMLVEGADGQEVGNPRGWLRWRRGDRLLITYSLLS